MIDVGFEVMNCDGCNASMTELYCRVGRPTKLCSAS